MLPRIRRAFPALVLSARAHCQQLSQRGVSHYATLRALAFKWIRILYRCWRDRGLYDEQRYRQALRRRGTPLYLGLLCREVPV